METCNLFVAICVMVHDSGALMTVC